jgi:hypothetical protein
MDMRINDQQIPIAVDAESGPAERPADDLGVVDGERGFDLGVPQGHAER